MVSEDFRKQALGYGLRRTSCTGVLIIAGCYSPTFGRITTCSPNFPSCTVSLR